MPVPSLHYSMSQSSLAASLPSTSEANPGLRATFSSASSSKQHRTSIFARLPRDVSLPIATFPTSVPVPYTCCRPTVLYSDSLSEQPPTSIHLCPGQCACALFQWTQLTIHVTLTSTTQVEQSRAEGVLLADYAGLQLFEQDIYPHPEEMFPAENERPSRKSENKVRAQPRSYRIRSSLFHAHFAASSTTSSIAQDPDHAQKQVAPRQPMLHLLSLRILLLPTVTLDTLAWVKSRTVCRQSPSLAGRRRAFSLVRYRRRPPRLIRLSPRALPLKLGVPPSTLQI